MIQLLMEQKVIYTPQNLVEEFGSVDRLLFTAKTLMNELKMEGVFSHYFENVNEF